MQVRATVCSFIIAIGSFHAVAQADDGPDESIRPSEGSWMPAEVGRSWTYEYVRERTRDAGTGTAESTSVKGILTERIVRAAPEFGREAVELRADFEPLPEQSAGATPESRLRYLIATGASYSEVARKELDPLTGVRELQRFAPPLARIKQGVPAGDTWTVGRWKAAGVPADFEAEVLGVQDAKTPAGLYEKCLVVRTTASLSGSIEVSGARVKIEDGRYVATEWYAPGVGRVLVKEELVQTMSLPDGSKVEFREDTQFALSALSAPSALSKFPTDSAAPASPSLPVRATPSESPTD